MIECQNVKDINETTILNKQGVVGVGIGEKWSDGLPRSTPAILVFVEKKRTKRGVIQKFSADDLIPTQIDGVPTDVIEVGKIVKQIKAQAKSLTTRVRPLKPGFSCSHRNVTAGTIGGFFIDKDNEPVILSNNHVIANENKGTIGDAIYQPATYDSKGNLDFRNWPEPVEDLPYFATLKKFVQLTNTGNKTDSGVARINQRLIDKGLIDILYPIVNQKCSGFGTPIVGQQVQKFGRTTGYTTSRVIATNASFTVEYDFGPATFQDCVVFSAFSSGGDSGSLIMDMSMTAIAHLFAGSNKVTIGNPISYAVQEYGLKLWNKTNVSPTIEFNETEWRKHSSNGTIETVNGITTIKSLTNQFCFMEDSINGFTSVSVKINTGTDKGATWGPGLVVQWPNGIIKVNLRYNDKFCGCFNGNEVINIGKTRPNTDYTLRIRKTNNGTYLGEIEDSGSWYTVIEIPTSVLSRQAIAVRIGKTDIVGQPSNYINGGTEDTFTLREYKIQ